MLSNVLMGNDGESYFVHSALELSDTIYQKHLNSVATTPLQFRDGVYTFVTELIHLLCTIFANYTFWHKKYELSLTIDIDFLHMYHLSVLPPKQHKIPLIVSHQINIANVSPNLTDAQMTLIILSFATDQFHT